MYYKCMNISKNSITLKDTDGKEYSINIPNETDGRELQDKYVHVINLGYNPMQGYHLLSICWKYIENYRRLASENTEESDKAYSKALMLGRLYDSTIEYKTLKDYIVITDKNNKMINKSKVKVDTVLFVGNKPVYTEKNFSTELHIECNTAIIDNVSIYSQLVDNKIKILATNYIIKHKFVSIDTVDEVMCLFREACGLETEFMSSREYNIWHKETIDAQFYQKILVKFDWTKINKDKVVNRVIQLINESKEYISNYYKMYELHTYLILISNLYFLISMWLNCDKDIRIENLMRKVHDRLLESNIDNGLNKLMAIFRKYTVMDLYDKETNTIEEGK